LCCHKCFEGTADDVVAAAAAVYLLAALDAAAAAATVLAGAEPPTDLEQAFCLSAQPSPPFHFSFTPVSVGPALDAQLVCRASTALGSHMQQSRHMRGGGSCARHEK
jgi:hypothetical protein